MPNIYNMRPFMRMNAGGREEVEQFVAALSGKGLSVREVEPQSQVSRPDID